jgi:hypothetical protein
LSLRTGPAEYLTHKEALLSASAFGANPTLHFNHVVSQGRLVFGPIQSLFYPREITGTDEAVCTGWLAVAHVLASFPFFPDKNLMHRAI